MTRKKIIVPLATILLLVFGCQLILECVDIPRFILPKPSLILEAFAQNWVWLFTHLRMTLFEAVIGFAIAVLLGVVLALSYLFVPALESVVVPLAVALRNVPFVAIAPILFIVLGYGPAAKIVIVMVVTFFPVMSNLAAGFQSVNRNLLERFFVYQASKWQLFTKLQLPAAIPYFATGLEIGVSNAVIAAIVGELLGTTQGLGFVILMTVSQYQISLLMAAVVVTTIVSIILTTVLRGLTNLVFRPWLAC